MGTKARSIIDSAYARSTHNDPLVLATDKELIARISLRQSELFSMVNQSATPADVYFAGEAAVVGAAGVWARPADADIVVDVRDASGEKVNIVPLNDKEGETAPRIYPKGQSFHTVGLTGDPGATDTLTFIYARFPSAYDITKSATAVENETDDDWPTQFDSLLIIDLALYLAKKDERFGGIEAFMAEEAALMKALLDHVARANRAMRSRFGQRDRADHVAG